MSQVNPLVTAATFPTIPTQFPTDSGTAIPSANTLNIFGGNNITTSGAANTVTIDAFGLLQLAGGTMLGDLFLNGDPTAPTQAATKNYVDSIAAGLIPLDAVYAASTGNLTATYSNGASGVGATLTNSGALAAFSVDGTTPPISSPILIKNQSTTFQNGIYTLTTVGSGAVAWVLTRATFYDSPSEITPGDLVPVTNGTVNANTSWLQTATVVTVGVSPVLFTQFTFNPATFLKVANNLSDVASSSTSRTNLGLGTSDSPTFTGLTLSSLTASRLMASDGSKSLSSVSDLTTWVLGTSNRITSTSTGSGGVTLDISGSYVGQASITTLGTIGTGGWQGTIISPTYGGTGVNNAALTITLSSGGTGKVLSSDISGNAAWASLSSLGVTSVSGTTNRITSSPTTGAVVVDISASYVGQASITTLGTIGTGVWQGTIVSPTYGGTGINNAALTITLSSGATGKVLSSDSSGNATWVTLSSLGVISVSGTTNRITASPTTGAVVVDISAAYVGQSSITTLGTIASGTWQGTVVAGQYGGTGIANTGLTITLSSGAAGKYLASDSSGNGTWATISGSQITGAALTASNDTNVTLTLGGAPTTALLTASSITAGWTGTLSGTRGGTGVNNGASTITIGGNFAMSGSFTFTGTVTGNTAVTFPTSGTLATTAGTVSSITGTANQVIASASTGAVTLSLPQSIATTSGVQFGAGTFGAVNASNGEAVKINGNNTQNFIGFYNNTNRQGYVGTNSGGSGFIVNSDANLTLQCAGGSSITCQGNVNVVNSIGIGATAPSTAGTITTAPPSSHTATVAFGTTLTLGTAKQNTTGYNLLVSIGISVSAASGGSFIMGVGPTSTPTTDTFMPSFGLGVGTGATVTGAICVPNNYYLLVNSSGTVTINAVNLVSSPY